MKLRPAERIERIKRIEGGRVRQQERLRALGSLVRSTAANLTRTVILYYLVFSI